MTIKIKYVDTLGYANPKPPAPTQMSRAATSRIAGGRPAMCQSVLAAGVWLIAGNKGAQEKP